MPKRHPPNASHAKERPSLCPARRLPRMAPSQLGDQPLLLGHPLVFVLCKIQACHHRNGKPEINTKFPEACVGTITPKGFWEKTTCAQRKEGWARGLETENWGRYQLGVPFAHSCQLSLKPLVITVLQYQLVLAVSPYSLANEDFMACFQNTSLADQVEDSSAQQTVFIHVWNHSSQRTTSEKVHWYSKNKKKRLVLHLRPFCMLENVICPPIGLLTPRTPIVVYIACSTNWDKILLKLNREWGSKNAVFNSFSEKVLSKFVACFQILSETVWSGVTVFTHPVTRY